ncbi:helix-turn-helix transcriptional regulator [Gynuella sunshinyii]|uniref:AraC-type DNA-binding domain-containing protein n=1 Tax=Gynuella sunshinyii YC6258 TaxID=1445510 RepID=A0A0C5VHY0_9GAMM|nr:helix-turn-helix transcriptional regulator [Gynuella sunshinyii]AJQ92978.1 araC-type DNA-binding domain-containing protein [Gynuella sunshinyii YC6258]
MQQSPPSGLLSRPDRPFTLQRLLPADDLAEFVDYFWVVEWQLPMGESFVSENFPHPCVHMVYEPGHSALFGPIKGHFKKTLMGQGRAIGCRFKPGLFYPWIKRPLAEMVDSQLDVAAVLSVSSQELEARLDAQLDIGQAVSEFTELLIAACALLHPEKQQGVLAHTIVATMEQNTELLKVEQVCSRFQISRRQLERLFYKHVGLSPKWVLRIYRLQQLANEMINHPIPDWTELAHRLGYFDQAHCIRDFKQITGKTPSSYCR